MQGGVSLLSQWEGKRNSLSAETWKWGKVWEVTETGPDPASPPAHPKDSVVWAGAAWRPECGLCSFSSLFISPTHKRTSCLK